MAKIIERVKGADFVQFTVGKTVLKFSIADIHKDCLDAVIVHGLNAKIGDVAGKSDLTDAERVSLMQAVIDNLKKGIFNSHGGGGSSMLAEALARVKKIDIEAAGALIAKMDDDQLTAVKNHPAVKAALSKIKQERDEVKAKGAKVESLDAILEKLK